MKKNVSLSAKKRVWELDAARGFLTLGLLLFHLYFTLDAFYVNGHYTKIDSYAFVNAVDPLRIFWGVTETGKLQRVFLGKYFDFVNRSGVNLFFIISGISCRFSRDNLKSGLRLMGGAAFVSGFTKLLALCTGDPGQFTRFGALHCYAACHLIYSFFLEGRKNSVLLTTAIPSLLIGYFLRYVYPMSSEFALLYPFGVREIGAIGRDYWPIFPMLGWFLAGVILGRRWYQEKDTRFPNSRGINLTRPIRLLGRHSGVIYCGHMVIYTVVFCGAGYIFDLY